MGYARPVQRPRGGRSRPARAPWTGPLSGWSRRPSCRPIIFVVIMALLSVLEIMKSLLDSYLRPGLRAGLRLLGLNEKVGICG